MASSVVVVEIDTRKGPVKTVFESSVSNQTEHAKQFWKTLSLAPHIESSLYSKEISQQIKPNSLKPLTIDNTRKPIESNPRTDAFLKNVQVLNQVDRIMSIQRKLAKIESIRRSHKLRREKSLEMISNAQDPRVRSESARGHHKAEDEFMTQASLDLNEYEANLDDLNNPDVVKVLNWNE